MKPTFTPKQINSKSSSQLRTFDLRVGAMNRQNQIQVKGEKSDTSTDQFPRMTNTAFSNCAFSMTNARENTLDEDIDDLSLVYPKNRHAD